MRTIYTVGSINQDIVVTSERAPSPGETVFGSGLSFFPGGKGANQAVAARLLGGRVRFIGKIGSDAFGAEMRRYLATHGLAELLIESDSEPTGAAVILVDGGGENSITVISGANATLSADECTALAEASAGDLLVLQNEISVDATLELLSEARRRSLTTIFNAAPAVRLPANALEHLDLAVVNEHEYETFFGEALVPGEPEELAGAVDRKAAETGVGVILTLGAAGAIGCYRGERAEVQGRRVTPVDTTGAGDCFVGALSVGLAEERNLSEALRFANAAASLAVTKMGASASFPARAEVETI